MVKAKKRKNAIETESIDSDPLARYLEEISRYPLLDSHEEIRLGRTIHLSHELIEKLDAMHASGGLSDREWDYLRSPIDREMRSARDTMVRANLRLVVAIARNYQHRGLPLVDLVDEGNIGLIEAVERFDYTLGWRFSTYGAWWIRQAIIKCLANNGRIIRIPIHMLNTIRKCHLGSQELSQELGREPKDEELAARMHMEALQIRRILALSDDAASLDATVSDDGTTYLCDLIADEASRDPLDEVFSASLRELIRDIVELLPERENTIINRRFGLNGEEPLTLEATSKILGITRERVRQIQNRAMEEIRAFIEARAPAEARELNFSSR